MSMDIPQEVIDEFVGVSHGDFARVKALLEQHPGLVNVTSSWGERPIEAAAQTGQVEIVTYLLEHSAPLEICTAAMLGQKDTVAAMLAVDSSMSQATGAHGLPVMYFAAIRGDQEIAELLRRHGAPVNGGEGVSTPLHGAVTFNQPGMVRWLLDHQANPLALDFNKQTPYEAARDQGREEIAILLEVVSNNG